MDGEGHAVVIGSGTAGLTAARVLARYMNRVTVIERDRTPRGTERRRGIPQARHTHSLMPAAEAGLERLFPGIGRDLTTAGAVRVRMARDMLVHGPAGWHAPSASPATFLSAGRDLIDSVIRTRLLANANVRFLHGHDVVALEPGRNDTVTGVWARARVTADGRSGAVRRDRGTGGTWGAPELLPAEFVVDASGSASPAPRWLRELGYAPPQESVVAAHASYASTLLAPPVGHIASWKSLLLLGAPGSPLQAQLNPVEGGRWSLTLRCGEGMPLPTDHLSLIAATAALSHPLLHDVTAAAEPLGPVYTCTATENRWRHYERLRHWPDQFLVLGDALATLDPAHGQGITLAVQGALTLDHLLDSHGTTTGLSYRLRRAIAHQLSPTWRTSTQNLKLARPHTSTTSAAGGLRGRLARRSAARVEAAATTSEHAATLLLEQWQALAPRGPLGPRALWAARVRAPVTDAPLPSASAGPSDGTRRSTARPPRPALGRNSPLRNAPSRP
ncbi:NAD(P)/FAD-dependent oxidoreductase [Streptomyces sp. NPDC088785]|uniref:NAD(P)/FAD-dependent oxidoreductase n=1 Tax=Streptomyces sp. NPDC088785 TaxID=3365897 RepID=UPI0038301D9A